MRTKGVRIRFGAKYTTVWFWLLSWCSAYLYYLRPTRISSRYNCIVFYLIVLYCIVLQCIVMAKIVKIRPVWTLHSVGESSSIDIVLAFRWSLKWIYFAFRWSIIGTPNCFRWSLKWISNRFRWSIIGTRNKFIWAIIWTPKRCRQQGFPRLIMRLYLASLFIGYLFCG